MLLLWVSVLLVVAASDYCPLMNGMESSKPSPSLWKCYKYNKEACCVSTHDNVINDAFESLMSSSCQRSFGDLETYFCTGCNPLSGKNINTVDRSLTLCRTFAEAVWGNTLELPSDSFDNCGMNTYWRKNSTTVMQSKQWPNAYAFFAEVKPPYFEDYTIRIVSDDQPCFDAAFRVFLSFLALVSLVS